MPRGLPFTAKLRLYRRSFIVRHRVYSPDRSIWAIHPIQEEALRFAAIHQLGHPIFKDTRVVTMSPEAFLEFKRMILANGPHARTQGGARLFGQPVRPVQGQTERMKVA